jgi:hypothetical protein
MDAGREQAIIRLWNHHVQAIIVSIDQYAESALGNREYFLNRPYGIGGSLNGNCSGVDSEKVFSTSALRGFERS